MKIPELDRITFDPQIMHGQACIRGIRVTVSLILNLVANGMSTPEIIRAYPYLEPEDVAQALHYAAWLAEERQYDRLEADSTPRILSRKRSQLL